MKYDETPAASCFTDSISKLNVMTCLTFIKVIICGNYICYMHPVDIDIHIYISLSEKQKRLIPILSPSAVCSKDMTGKIFYYTAAPKVAMISGSLYMWLCKYCQHKGLGRVYSKTEIKCTEIIRKTQAVNLEISKLIVYND